MGLLYITSRFTEIASDQISLYVSGIILLEDAIYRVLATVLSSNVQN